MEYIATAHTRVVMSEGDEREYVVNVGDQFPARIGTGNDFMDMVLGLKGALIVDFGDGEAAYSMEPDENGKSYATWFDLKEVN